MRAGVFAQLILTSILAKAILAGAETVEHEEERDGKLLPIFSVVTFPNDLCVGTESGSTLNGTCYTSAECSSKGGTSSGSCASGFGVCCVFSIACGTTSAENHTYLVQASATTGFTSPCTYTICKCSSDICRIRFDFTTFQVAVPYQGTTKATITSAADEYIAHMVGDCVTDTFAISGQPGTPQVCGVNTGQHLIVDALDMCHTANFNIGGVSATRLWNIHVTQYTCAEDQDTAGGPPGCLQWLRGTTGRLSSLGYDRSITVVTSSHTHLSSQNYQVCTRRESGYCYICYTPKIEGANAVATQTSFGISISAGNAATIAESTRGEYCNWDYLSIAGAQTATNAAILDVAAAEDALHGSLVCGRYLATTVNKAATVTLCTRNYPFRLGVIFDSNEIENNDGTFAATADNAESALSPGGILGFDLYYIQGSC